MSRVVRLVSDRIPLGIEHHLGVLYEPQYEDGAPFVWGNFYLFGVTRLDKNTDDLEIVPEKTVTLNSQIREKRVTLAPGQTVKLKVNNSSVGIARVALLISASTSDGSVDIIFDDKNKTVVHTNETSWMQYIDLTLTPVKDFPTVTYSLSIDRQIGEWGYNLINSTSPYPKFPSSPQLVAQWDTKKFENVSCTIVFGQRFGERLGQTKIHINSIESKFLILPYRWKNSGCSKADIVCHFDVLSENGDVAKFKCKELAGIDGISY